MPVHRLSSNEFAEVILIDDVYEAGESILLMSLAVNSILNIVLVIYDFGQS